MWHNRYPHVLAIGGLAVLAVVTAGCTSSATGAPAPAAATTTAAGGATFVPVPATAAAAPTLKFPNTDLTVRFTGYDDTTRMVTFVLVTWIPGGEDDGHYAPNATDSAQHRLPLASNVHITSWSNDCAGDGGALGADGSYPCTTQQLVAGLHGGGAGLSIAALHVDGTDHVSTVREIFTP